MVVPQSIKHIVVLILTYFLSTPLAPSRMTTSRLGLSMGMIFANFLASPIAIEERAPQVSVCVLRVPVPLFLVFPVLIQLTVLIPSFGTLLLTITMSSLLEHSLSLLCTSLVSCITTRGWYLASESSFSQFSDLFHQKILYSLGSFGHEF